MTRRVRMLTLALAVSALLAPVVIGAAPANSLSRVQPADQGNHNGAPPGFVCDRLETITLPNGRTLCTHGPDPEEAFAADFVDLAARAEAPWPCYSAGPAYHALYAHTAAQASRLPTLRPLFELAMRHIQGEFETSATDNGGPGKLLRVLTDPACGLVIDDVVVSDAAMSDFRTMISELQNQGYSQADRKYLIWADSTAYCGIGTFHSDNTKSSTNRNNTSISYARADTRCWDNSEAHEIIHNLGGIQDSAPHSSSGGHCFDEYDHLCYRDGGSYFTNGGDLVVHCLETARNLMFDCGHDDYYDATGSDPYLASHWNVATDSRYLIDSATAPSPTTTSSTTTSTSTSTTSTTVPPTTSGINHLDHDTATLEGSVGKWIGWYSAAVTRTTEQAHSGTASLKVSPSGSIWGASVNNWPGFPATAGNKTITFSAQSSYAFNASLLVRWKDSAGTDISTHRLWSPVLDATWQTASATASAPAGTAFAYVELTGDNAPAGAAVYFDDFYVGEAGTGTTTTSSTTTTAPTTTTTTAPTTTTSTSTTTTTSSTTTTTAPTTTTTSTPSTTVAPDPQATMYSLTKYRDSPVPLAGATVSGSIYAFATDTGDISKVEFWLDDLTMTGKPRESETYPPYDFASGLTSYAYAWNTTTVADGAHTISARVTFDNGTTKTTSASFTVDN